MGLARRPGSCKVARAAPARDVPMLSILSILLHALQILIIVDVVLSWVKPDPTEFPRNLTTQVTEPLYAPIHAILNPRMTGGLDLAPLIMILLLSFMRRMMTGTAS